MTMIPSFTQPAEAPASTAEPEAFLWVGRIVEYKLPLRYVELARALPDARFVMVAPSTGETPGGLKRRLAEESRTCPNLEVLPNMRRERVLKLIAGSVAVIGTSHHEGMPNVFLEAWSRGVPVISLHFDPDGRISGEGIGICAEGSWDRFVDAARQLWDDPRLRARLGESGRRYVTRVHSQEAVGGRWAATLGEVLSG